MNDELTAPLDGADVPDTLSLLELLALNVDNRLGRIADAVERSADASEKLAMSSERVAAALEKIATLAESVIGQSTMTCSECDNDPLGYVRTGNGLSAFARD